MSKRVTITDLAKELSLSICTINKALTGKPPISEATRKRVVEAAARMGYRPNALARSMGRPVIKLAAIYPSIWPSHIGELFVGVKERLAELSDYRVEASFKTIPNVSDSKPFLRAIQQFTKEGVKGIICSFGIQSLAERREILKSLSATGLPHVALGNAAEAESPLLSCVWHDCILCGRLAAELLSLAVPNRSKTAIFIGDRNFPDHALKIRGFQEELESRGMRRPEVCEAFDDPAKAFPAAERLFKLYSDISGIYIGTENAQGILEFLEKSGRKAKVKVVATGLSDPVVRAMETSLAHASIHQRQNFQGRLAVDNLFNFLETGVSPKRETLVVPQVVFQGNFSSAE